MASNFKHGPKPVIGLIGAIGAGKTTAAQCFASRGAQVIDADVLGHEALTQQEIIEKVVARWGEGVRGVDGTLDRKALARVVFANPEERRALEEMVFPYIGQRTHQKLQQAMNNPDVSFVVLDAAVLLEAGWGAMVDRIVYVDAPRELRLARLAARSGWTEAELTARESAQWPAEQKKARSDAVIVNDAGPTELQDHVDRLLTEWEFIGPRTS